MKTYEEYIQTLSDQTKIQMILDFEELREKGEIGSCSLRNHSTQYCKQSGIEVQWVGVITVMTTLANECYRYFAWKYIKENNP